jgi:hypothetical protein
MPPQYRLRPDDDEDLQDRRTPAANLNQEQSIEVGEMASASHLTPQQNHMMPQRRILGLKPAPRLEGAGQNRPNEADYRDHYPARLGDSLPY